MERILLLKVAKKLGLSHRSITWLLILLLVDFNLVCEKGFSCGRDEGFSTEVKGQYGTNRCWGQRRRWETPSLLSALHRRARPRSVCGRFTGLLGVLRCAFVVSQLAPSRRSSIIMPFSYGTCSLTFLQFLIHSLLSSVNKSFTPLIQASSKQPWIFCILWRTHRISISAVLTCLSLHLYQNQMRLSSFVVCNFRQTPTPTYPHLTHMDYHTYVPLLLSLCVALPKDHSGRKNCYVNAQVNRGEWTGLEQIMLNCLLV